MWFHRHSLNPRSRPLGLAQSCFRGARTGGSGESRCNERRRASHPLREPCPTFLILSTDWRKTATVFHVTGQAQSAELLAALARIVPVRTHPRLVRLPSLIHTAVAFDLLGKKMESLLHIFRWGALRIGHIPRPDLALARLHAIRLIGRLYPEHPSTPIHVQGIKQKYNPTLTDIHQLPILHRMASATSKLCAGMRTAQKTRYSRPSLRRSVGGGLSRPHRALCNTL